MHVEKQCSSPLKEGKRFASRVSNTALPRGVTLLIEGQVEGRRGWKQKVPELFFPGIQPI